MSVKYVSIIVVLLQRGLAEGAQGVVDLVEGVGLQHLDHVPLEVERGEGGEASQRAPAQVPDTVLREDEEGEEGEGGEGAGDLLQLAALQVQVLEGLLQPGEGSLRQSEIVVRELESFQSDCDEGVVGDILDPVISQI